MSDLSNIETLRQYAKTIAAVAESMETNIEELESQFRRSNNNNTQTDDGAIAEMKEELTITRKAASDIEELVGKIDRGEITDITESDIEQLVGKIDEN